MKEHSQGSSEPNRPTAGKPLVLGPVIGRPPPTVTESLVNAGKYTKEKHTDSIVPTLVNEPSATEVKVPTPPRAMEICAGSGGFSYALWNKGFDATGVNWNHNRHAPRILLIMRDLTDPTQQAEVNEIKEGSDYLHMAPPCGTASEARNIKVSEEDKAKGAPSPQPLRDADNPWGKPGLSEYNKMKADKANIIYRFCMTLIT